MGADEKSLRAFSAEKKKHKREKWFQCDRVGFFVEKKKKKREFCAADAFQDKTNEKLDKVRLYVCFKQAE